jgi:LuxR family maltose regulon positive regulatory protein
MVRPPQEPVTTSPVLATKFFIPRRRAGAVPRRRLLERLDRGLESKLTLVSAPPGFGKTTLLAEWLASPSAKERDIAWLALDQNDNHQPTFWSYLVGALERVRPDAGKGGVLEMLRSQQPPPIETLLVMVLNEVAANPDDLVLVLDDYHVIDVPAIHAGIEFLLEHMPPQMHLIIASRADPSVTLPRLRARGELTEVRATDLRFTGEEANAFLNEGMGLELNAQDVAALESRTEGWAAALQLAGLSIQGRDDVASFISAFTGNNRYIVDYLVDEVLARQPAPVRDFLLRTSILEGLSGPLCDAVTQQTGARAMLEALERSNLFIVALDGDRQWYRYHHLFAEVLRAHLLEEMPEQIAMLHGRASEWYEENGQRADAIRSAQAAHDFGRAARLVELEAESAMKNHQPDRLIAWLKPIPDEIIRAMPILGTYYAMALQGMGDLEVSTARLDDAERALGESAAGAKMVIADLPGFESLPSRIALARGYLTMAAGDLAGTIEQARRALEFLHRDEHHWLGTATSLLALPLWARGEVKVAQESHLASIASFERAGDVALMMISSYNNAEMLKALGRPGEARKTYERALQFAATGGNPNMPGVPNLHFGLSELYCERNDLHAALHHLQQGEESGIFTVPPATPYRRLMARARLRLAEGDIDEALELLEEGEPLYIRTPVPNVRPVAAWKVRLKLAQGRLAEALDWVQAQQLSVDDELRYMLEYDHITVARVRNAHYQRDGDMDGLRSVDRFLERLRHAAVQGGRMGAVIETSILQAIVGQALDDVPASLVHLERALALAEPEGYFRTFVDEGLPMRDLLRQALGKGAGGDYARRLLAAFEAPKSPGISATAVANTGGLAEPLTTREIEILRLVAAGMRNQEIADLLVISLPTVKRHIANTYGKLGVTHRTEAVALANELNLLGADGQA